jgi:septal ring factor EnvC (AmiA/AmiB activator)
MQTRHRIPTIFNLSMVDVLCCALGCVILLWLVYFKEARSRAIAAGQTDKQLALTKLKLEDVTREFTSAQHSLQASKQKNEHLGGQLTEVVRLRDELLAKWETTEQAYQAALANLKETRDSLAVLHANKSQLEKLSAEQKLALAAAKSETGALSTKLIDAEKSSAQLEKQIGSFETLSKEFGEQLTKLERKAVELESDLGKRKLDIAEGNKRLEELLTVKTSLEQSLTAAKSELASRTKDLTEIKLANHGLSGENRVLSQEVKTLKAAAENRFAGIELTGTRVLFLVDMSGSMGMKDDVVEDPDKWPLVCEILGKLMNSLPDLKQFQIILFSNRIRYPLGNAGKWHDFGGLNSVKTAVAAVRAVKPQNETNMSAVFEEAFRYRAQGLDTIYFLSDGLPNMGEGLPPNAGRLSEAEKGTILAKHVRDQLKTKWNAPQGSAKQRVRINAVGFYFDSPDVGAFLWALARDNDGSFVGMSKP